MIKYMTCDLLDWNTHRADYICHQVNCRGEMNSGIAKAIREKYPNVFECYYDLFTDAQGKAANSFPEIRTSVDFMLGAAQVVPVPEGRVVNLFAQIAYNGSGLKGKGPMGDRYTDYDAFYECLETLRALIPPGTAIAFPDMIGCGRGGASAKIITAMIEDVLGSRHDIVYCTHKGEKEND